MKKMISVGLAAMLFVMSITGCSGSETSESSGAGSTAAAESQDVQEESGEKSKIQIMGPWVV